MQKTSGETMFVLTSQEEETCFMALQCYFEGMYFAN
jgi:hypothetical protein